MELIGSTKQMISASTALPDADVIVDEVPNSGIFNMAMDAALLQLASDRKQSVIRIYQWSEPTVTLGYFQGSGQSVDSPFPELPVVRRLTGGGAILHDREVTYSCCVPASHPIRQDPSELYVIVHRALIRLLTECGIPCSLRSEFEAVAVKTVQTHSSATGETLKEPFLCFLRSNPNDIVDASGVKIVGSAQRRRKGVTLQHGSIILAASRLAPFVDGIRELSPSFDDERFQRLLPETIASSIAGKWAVRTYASDERDVSEEMAAEALRTSFHPKDGTGR